MPRISKKQQRALTAIEALKELYPLAECSLTAANAFELLVAVRLSAQCTDARVDLVTPALFQRFPDAATLSVAEQHEVEELIRSCGLYKTKARDLIAMADMLVHVYNNVIPNTVEELVKLPGVGRKTANLVCGDIYGMPGAVVADTHCIRISNRLGLCKTKDPKQVEMQLRKLLPPEESNAFCHRLVHFGRDICNARKPACDRCPLNSDCPSSSI